MTRWPLLVHILALIIWLGPSLGGSFMYVAARRTGDPGLIRWSLRRSIALYNLEHAAFGVVLASGVAMLAASGWGALGAPWLRWKLALVGGLILPVEIWDMVVVARLIRALGPGAASRGAGDAAGPDGARLATAVRAHDRVLGAGGVLFSIGALGALALAVLKP